MGHELAEQAILMMENNTPFIDQLQNMPANCSIAGTQYENNNPVMVLRKTRSHALTEPFLGYEFVGDDIFTVSYDAARDVVFPSASASPAGFIFHMGRCGSTVVSQMLRRVKDSVVLGEPSAINQLFHRNQPDGEEQIRDFQILINSFYFLHRNQGSKLYIKFSSWMVLHIQLIQRAFPHTPCLFIYRNPIEVMASLEKKPMPWLDRRERKGFLNSLPWELRDPVKSSLQYAFENKVAYFDVKSDLELYARVLVAMCNAIISVEKAVELLNYTDIPAGAVEKLQQVFGITLESGEIESMLEEAKPDIRKPELGEFVQDSATKQHRASAESRYWVDNLVHDAMLKIPGIAEQNLIRSVHTKKTLFEQGPVKDRSVKPTAGLKKFSVSW